MQVVTVIQNEKALAEYLKKVPAEEGKRYKYYCCQGYCGSMDLLEEKNFQRASFTCHDEEFKKKYIAEYNRLIANIAKDNPHRVWWATDLASKNRSSTQQLPYFIEQFLIIIHLIKNTDFDHFIIVAPEEVILPSLKKAFHALDIYYVYIGGHFRIKVNALALRSRKIVVLIAHVVRIMLRSLYARLQLASLLKKRLQGKNNCYVIKTFVYNHSFIGDKSYRDVFFGRLPDSLKNQYEVVILATIIGNFRYCVQKIKECETVTVVPFEALLSLADIFQAVLEIFFNKISLKGEFKIFETDVSDIVKLVEYRTLKGLQFHHFIHYWAMKSLIKNTSIQNYLQTYENYPWERMCLTALREHSPSTKIIGYQHTVVPQSYLNMFVGKEERSLMPFPDRIFTAGSEPKRIMEHFGEYEGVDIQPSCGLRFEYLSATSTVQRKKPIKNIFVPLEGLLPVRVMAEYVMRELGNDARFQIRFRTHPLLPWKELERRYGLSMDKVANCELSQNHSLSEDIEWADLVLYWSTTVSLEALMVGKPVIHFDRGYILSYDPLFACPYLKWSVAQEESLISKIEQIEALDGAQFGTLQGQAREYINQYFYPVSDEGLDKFGDFNRAVTT